MTQRTALHRAFQLARSGQLTSINAIQEALQREGFRDADTALDGAYIRAQLTRVLESAAHLSAR